MANIDYGLALLPHHRKLLEDSAIAPDVASARGYISVVTTAHLSRYGFTRNQRIVPTLLIPSFNVLGGQTFAQHRPDNPRTNAKGQIIKYETPTQTLMHIDCHPFNRPKLANPNEPLVITEGARKADAATSAGLCAVALLGVWNWRGRNEYGGKTALADWENIALNGRQAIVAFDSDVMEKREVYLALCRLKVFLERRGAHFYTAYLPSGRDGEKIGLDDFLARNTVKDFWELVTDKLRPLPTFDTTQPIGGYRMNDAGNADRFADQHNASMRYVEDWNSWYFWCGTHWERDNIGYATRLAIQTVRRMYEEAAKIDDESARKELVKHAHRSESGQRLREMLGLARANAALAATPNEFDQNKWLLNTKNGTVDLTTGDMTEHDPADMITRLAPVKYDPEAQSFEWEQFLRLATNGDEKMMRYIKRIAGYFLTGSTKEGAMFYIKGPTRTGKTTTLQALRSMLGSYAWRASFESFLASQKSGGPMDDIAHMEGARLVIASEVAHGKRFDEALLKELTGEDDVNARKLYQHSRSYKPEFKLLFAANDFPFIRSDDSGAWARMHLIEFANPELADRKYLELKQNVRDLERNGDAILAWAIEGCLEWQQEDDLGIPEKVLEDVEAQRAEFDPLQDWIDECADVNTAYRAALEDLFGSYNYFKLQERSTKPLGRKGFSQALSARGFVKGQSELPNMDKRLYFIGLRLRR